MDDHALARSFEEHRPHLLRVAHRLLGSRSDAQDAVQDAWLRLQRTDTGTIDNLSGWLTTTVSRLCLDRLRARRTRPETPVEEAGLDAPGTADPAADAVVADAVGRALLVVLDTLSPAERVVLVLHDVFDVPFGDIAPILDRSAEATKKLGARARRRARIGAEAEPGDLETRRRVVAAFVDALRAGDMRAMLQVLAPDAVRHVDPVLLRPGQAATVHGAAAIVEEARSFSGPARGAEPALVDGVPGAVVLRDGAVVLALTFEISDGVVEAFEVVAAPDRLAALRIDT